jgi:hypothetical protein
VGIVDFSFNSSMILLFFSVYKFTLLGILVCRDIYHFVLEKYSNRMETENLNDVFSNRLEY